MQKINFGTRMIGDGEPVFIIAEAGVNHNGELTKALELVDIARDAGADAVKFQLYRADEQVSRAAPTAQYQRDHTRETQMLEMARSYDLPWEAHRDIKRHCDSVGITYLSSCFDTKAVDFFLELRGAGIKVGSGEITNYPLLAYMSATGKPILLSTGMSTLDDVAGAVAHIRASGPSELALFQCTSNYPTDPGDANLRALQTLKHEFDMPVGYSDHTRSNTAAIAAVALGASIIEKHFTLDRALPGPDHHMSLSPDELRAYVADIRTTERALGNGIKEPCEQELATMLVARRSLVSTKLIPAGDTLTDENVTLKRPATGIDPRLWPTVRGRKVKAEIQPDIPITWDDLVE